MTNQFPDWVDVRDEHRHKVAEYSPRLNRLRIKPKHGRRCEIDLSRLGDAAKMGAIVASPVDSMKQSS